MSYGHFSFRPGISSREIAIRQRLWRRFFCAYMLPIRDLCATAFCVLLSFVFYVNIIINNAAFRHRRYVYAARLMGLHNRSITLHERWCRQFARGRKVSVDDSIIIIIMAGMAVVQRGWLPHRGELFSKCEEFLAGRSQFDSDHAWHYISCCA